MPTNQPLPPFPATPLERLGELYRDADGHEVWRIRSAAGVVVAEGVASDHDAAWLAEAEEGLR